MLIMPDPDMLLIRAALLLIMPVIMLVMRLYSHLLLVLKELSILQILLSLHPGILRISPWKVACILLTLLLKMLGSSLVLIWPEALLAFWALLLLLVLLKAWLSKLEVFMSFEVLYHLINTIILGVPYVIIIGILWRVFKNLK